LLGSPVDGVVGKDDGILHELTRLAIHGSQSISSLIEATQANVDARDEQKGGHEGVTLREISIE
jgi:hypothetical protein